MTQELYVYSAIGKHESVMQIQLHSGMHSDIRLACMDHLSEPLHHHLAGCLLNLRLLLVPHPYFHLSAVRKVSHRQVAGLVHCTEILVPLLYTMDNGYLLTTDSL